MLLLDVTIVVVALPDVQISLHAGFDQVQWVAGAYALTLASLLFTSGPVVLMRAGEVVSAVRQGTVAHVIGQVPAPERAPLGQAVATSFTGGLDDLLWFTAVVAFVGASGSVVLIRSRDFAPSGRVREEAGAKEPVAVA